MAPSFHRPKHSMVYSWGHSHRDNTDSFNKRVPLSHSQRERTTLFKRTIYLSGLPCQDYCCFFSSILSLLSTRSRTFRLCGIRLGGPKPRLFHPLTRLYFHVSTSTIIFGTLWLWYFFCTYVHARNIFSRYLFRGWSFVKLSSNARLRFLMNILMLYFEIHCRYVDRLAIY